MPTPMEETSSLKDTTAELELVWKAVGNDLNAQRAVISIGLKFATLLQYLSELKGEVEKIQAVLPKP